MTRTRTSDLPGICPSCQADVILSLDSDGNGRVWVHEVWRPCSCPMPAKLEDYNRLEDLLSRYLDAT